MTHRCVVSLPATVYGQHSPTVFSAVYLCVFDGGGLSGGGGGSPANSSSSHHR